MGDNLGNVDTDMWWYWETYYYGYVLKEYPLETYTEIVTYKRTDVWDLLQNNPGRGMRQDWSCIKNCWSWVLDKSDYTVLHVCLKFSKYKVKFFLCI